MHAELVVPNLEGFKLKPYVSFRTDVEIEKRRRTYEAKVCGSLNITIFTA
ncbi:hypothetical protein OESDEN_12195 [Oesophagostomum dentatum]|uniref:Uncharacterized protein n=1 Tax=Oesophagostomum dentatum TaxID=61180 RepID=A0A0B1SAY0_OESDE|nr:hypothetical protein OESDEN_19930 [Oesophagostomum dentatum]KHJ88014.1 hypothetical protein OESDEN_12195 [Oesophagostomum dentatum]